MLHIEWTRLHLLKLKKYLVVKKLILSFAHRSELRGVVQLNRSLETYLCLSLAFTVKPVYLLGLFCSNTTPYWQIPNNNYKSLQRGLPQFLRDSTHDYNIFDHVLRDKQKHVVVKGNKYRANSIM